MRNPADAALCEAEASTIGREDVSVGGTTRLVYRLIVPDQEPTVIMATMTAAALAHRGEADELTLLAYGEAGEASGDFTRGRLVVAADGSATYDVCTAWNDAAGTILCADEVQFTADIFD